MIKLNHYPQISIKIAQISINANLDSLFALGKRGILVFISPEQMWVDLTTIDQITTTF